jgi:hypothetical protein
MAALREIALAEGTDVAEICTRVAQVRGQGSLTSALRLYILKQYRERARALGPSAELARQLESFRRSQLATDERDYVLRHELDLDRVADADLGFAFLFTYWKALAKGGTRPRYDDFKLETLRSIGFDANVRLVDVEAPDPNEFRIIRQAPVTMIYRTPNGAPFKVMGDSLYAREIKVDYSIAKYKTEPMLQRLSVRTPEGALRYQRIMLPCSVGDGPTGRLIIGVAPLSGLAPPWNSGRADAWYKARREAGTGRGKPGQSQ